MGWSFGQADSNPINILRPHRLLGIRSKLSPSDRLDKKYWAGRKPAPVETPEGTVPLPDLTDAAVRRRQAEELKKLLKNRGRSRTLLSGRSGDQSPTPTRATTIGRG
jgi:hypothetical protein